MKKILSLMGAMVLLLSVFTFPASAQDLTIGTASELLAFAKEVNGGTSYEGQTVALSANINLHGVDWTPIGTSDAPFKGTFDGKGFTIFNLTVNAPNSDYIGLFGRTQQGAISNLTIENASVTGRSYVGAIVGSQFTGNMENCKLTGQIEITGNYDVAGLRGYGYGSITNCHVDAAQGSSVTGNYLKADLEGDNVGGLVAYMGEGSAIVSGCSVRGLSVSGTRKVGGVIAFLNYGNRAENISCEDVSVSSNADEGYVLANTNKISVGGLVGEMSSTDTAPSLLLNSSLNDVNVEGKEEGRTGLAVGSARDKADAEAAKGFIAVVGITQENSTSNGDNQFDQVSAILLQGKTQLYTTVDSAIADAEDGDTILLPAGEYTEKIILPVDKSLTFTGGKDAVISGGVDIAKGTLKSGYTAQFQNLTFTSQPITMTGWTQTMTQGNASFIVDDCVFHDILTDKTYTEANEGHTAAIHFNNGDDPFLNVTVTNSVFENIGIQSPYTDAGEGSHKVSALLFGARGTIDISNNVFTNINFNVINIPVSNNISPKKLIIENNVITNWAVRGNTGRALRLSAVPEDNSLKGNVFVSASVPEEILKSDQQTAQINLQENYWNGNSLPSMEGGVGGILITGSTPTLSSQALPIYLDKEKTQLSKVSLIDTVSGSNYSVTLPNLAAAVDDYSAADTYAVALADVSNENKEKIPLTGDQSALFMNLSVTKQGEPLSSLKDMTVIVHLPTALTDPKIYIPGNAEPISSTLSTDGKTLTFTADIPNDFAIVYTTTPVEKDDISSVLNITLEQTDSATYDIVLNAESGKLIHRFMAADLTFALTGTALYEIVPGLNMTVSKIADGRYEIHMNGSSQSALTGERIVIGSVRLSGYGTGTISVVDSESNAVQTALQNDNIVATYMDDALTLPKADYDLQPASADLTVEIAFNNNVAEGKAENYMKMNVNIVGADGSEMNIPIGADNYSADKATVVAEDLTANQRYTITVTGDGYRTARKTVLVAEGENAPVLFWNNVKDDTTQEYKNFLAGDIVMDNVINIYDLSAVVSYFGSVDIEENSEYIRYDLNRDGTIDSKDVAMVLVSWEE